MVLAASAQGQVLGGLRVRLPPRVRSQAEAEQLDDPVAVFGSFILQTREWCARRSGERCPRSAERLVAAGQALIARKEPGAPAAQPGRAR